MNPDKALARWIGEGAERIAIEQYQLGQDVLLLS
jgi:hypothetical protein